MRHRELKSSSLGWSWTLKLRAEPLPSDPSPYHAAMNGNDFGPMSLFFPRVWAAGSVLGSSENIHFPRRSELKSTVRLCPERQK